jgi:hypothetical protein
VFPVSYVYGDSARFAQIVNDTAAVKRGVQSSARTPVASPRLCVAAETGATGAARACEGGLCGSPGKTCFVAGTKIRTEHGLVAIEDVKVGDKV